MSVPAIAAYALPSAGEVPVSRVAWRADPQRAALLVHDMQQYFLAPFEVDAAPLAPMLEHLRKLLSCCREMGVPIFYTAQRGNQERRDRGLQAEFWGPGMSATPKHEAIVAALAPQVGDQVLVKHRYSAFQRSHFADLLRARQRDQLILGGVYAHIGVLATASEAFQRDIEPFVAADAVADFSRRHHDMALAVIAESCGVPLLTDTLLETLR